MHPFKAYMSLHCQLKEEDWEIIKPCLAYKVIQEKRILLKPGTICKNLYFLENGEMRIFNLNFGEDTTTHIIHPPLLFTSPQSFSQQVPSNEGIQAMEESYLWVISREDVHRLMEVPSWKNFISSL